MHGKIYILFFAICLLETPFLFCSIKKTLLILSEDANKYLCWVQNNGGSYSKYKDGDLVAPHVKKLCLTRSRSEFYEALMSMKKNQESLQSFWVKQRKTKRNYYLGFPFHHSKPFRIAILHKKIPGERKLSFNRLLKIIERKLKKEKGGETFIQSLRRREKSSHSFESEEEKGHIPVLDSDLELYSRMIKGE